MDIDAKIFAINVLIGELKLELRNKLEQKQQLMQKQQQSIGCECGVIIHYYDAHRLVNIYCPIHKTGG
jgi:hypothetical protein